MAMLMPAATKMDRAGKPTFPAILWIRSRSVKVNG